MTEEAKQAKGRRKRRKRKRKEDEFETYVLAIEDWEWSYSFGINQTTYRDGPYADYRHLHLIGKLIAPARIKADTAIVILMPEADLADKRYKDVPQSVGSVQLTRGQFTALLPMPSDALPPVLQTLIAGKLKFADLRGKRMRYGSALIQSYALEMNKEGEDMPESEIIL